MFECVCTREHPCMFKVPRSACLGISIRPCMLFPLSFRSEASSNTSLSVCSLLTVCWTSKLQPAHTESVERESTVRSPSPLFQVFLWSHENTAYAQRVQRLSDETDRGICTTVYMRERFGHLMFWRRWWISLMVFSQLYLQGRDYLFSAMSQSITIVVISM